MPTTINEAPPRSRIILRSEGPLLKTASEVSAALRNDVVVRAWITLVVLGQVTLLVGLLVVLQDLLSAELLAFSPRDLALAGELALMAFVVQYIWFGRRSPITLAKPVAEDEQPEPPEAG